MSDITYLATSVYKAASDIKDALNGGNKIRKEFNEICKKDDEIHHEALKERLIRERERCERVGPKGSETHV